MLNVLKRPKHFFETPKLPKKQATPENMVELLAFQEPFKSKVYLPALPRFAPRTSACSQPYHTLLHDDHTSRNCAPNLQPKSRTKLYIQSNQSQVDNSETRQENRANFIATSHSIDPRTDTSDNRQKLPLVPAQQRSPHEAETAHTHNR